MNTADDGPRYGSGLILYWVTKGRNRQQGAGFRRLALSGTLEMGQGTGQRFDTEKENLLITADLVGKPFNEAFRFPEIGFLLFASRKRGDADRLDTVRGMNKSLFMVERVIDSLSI